MVTPMTSTSTRPMIDATYTSGARIRTHRWSVAATITPSTTPMAMLTRCRLTKAFGSPRGQRRCGPRSPTTPAACRWPAAPRSRACSTQSRRAALTRVVVSTRAEARGRTAATLIVGAFVPVPRAEELIGGRISPSRAKTGSAAGGFARAARPCAACTAIPLTPYSASQILRTAGPEVPEPVPRLGDHHHHDVRLSYDATHDVLCLP